MTFLVFAKNIVITAGGLSAVRQHYPSPWRTWKKDKKNLKLDSFVCGPEHREEGVSLLQDDYCELCS